MSVWEDYKREEVQRDTLVGKYRCVIVDVEEGITGPNSKAPGLPKIIITVQPSGTKFKVKSHLVKNENFNKNATTFFDSFPEIGEGNFNFFEWIGCEGAAEFGEDKNGYTQVRWFIPASKAENLPPFVGDKPERQVATKLEEREEEDDDFPFDM